MPDVLMPRLSDTMTEGIVGQWLKHEGDVVQRGDALAEIETDKATMELEAYDSGVLARIIAPAGSTVPIGQPFAVIDDQATWCHQTSWWPRGFQCGAGPGRNGCGTGARHSTRP